MVPHSQHCMLYIVIYRTALVESEVSRLESRQKQVLILHQNILSLLEPPKLPIIPKSLIYYFFLIPENDLLLEAFSHP